MEIPSELEEGDFSVHRRADRWVVWVYAPLAVGFGVTVREAAKNALRRRQEFRDVAETKVETLVAA